MAEDTPEPAFDDIKGQINFRGFSDPQRDTILNQLEDAWDTEAGRDMIESGLNLNGNTGGNGLTYVNLNSQAELQSLASERSRPSAPAI